MTVQLMHYLAVYNYSWGSFALFNAENWDLIWFDLEADPALIATMIEREQEFWGWVVNEIEPPETAGAKAVEIPKIEGELTIVNTEDWQRMASDLREARELKEAASELEETAKTQIQERMHRDELHAVEVDGIARFYYRYQAGTTKWKETAEAIARAANLKTDAFLVKGDGFTKFTPYFLRPEEDPNG
jgi:predicted phage-related endonuclease